MNQLIAACRSRPLVLAVVVATAKNATADLIVQTQIEGRTRTASQLAPASQHVEHHQWQQQQQEEEKEEQKEEEEKQGMQPAGAAEHGLEERQEATPGKEAAAVSQGGASQGGAGEGVQELEVDEAEEMEQEEAVKEGSSPKGKEGSSKGEDASESDSEEQEDDEVMDLRCRETQSLDLQGGSLALQGRASGRQLLELGTNASEAGGMRQPSMAEPSLRFFAQQQTLVVSAPGSATAADGIAPLASPPHSMEGCHRQGSQQGVVHATPDCSGSQQVEV